MTSPRSFREAFTEDPADVEAKHYRVDWQKCDSDGVPNPENPLPPFCGHCTDEEYVGAIEYGDTIDREADVVWWPCDTLTLARQRDSARDWAAALEGQLAELKRQIREQADQWRVYSPGAFYPEASAYASGIEQCGDALIDLLEDFDLSLVAALTGGGDETEQDRGRIWPPFKQQPGVMSMLSDTADIPPATGGGDE